MGSTTTLMPPLWTRKSRLGGLVLEVHFVLEAGAAAADDGDAQDTVGASLFAEEAADFLGGAGTDFDQPSSPTR